MKTAEQSDKAAKFFFQTTKAIRTMSVATASMCTTNNNLMCGPQGKGSLSSPTIDYVANKKRRDDTYQNSSKSNLSEADFASPSSPQKTVEKDNVQHTSTITQHSQLNNQPTSSIACNGISDNRNDIVSNSYNAFPNGVAEGGHNYPPTYSNTSSGSVNNNNSNSNTAVDSTGPLPNEIFELLNEFWRPNEMVAPADTQLLNNNNGKFSRRSPDGSTDETAEEEKGLILTF